MSRRIADRRFRRSVVAALGALIIAPTLLVRVAPTAVADAIPSNLLAAALARFEGEYGAVISVYGQAAATFSDWQTAEPANTSSLDLPGDAQIYAAFVEGAFQVVAPPALNVEVSHRLPMNNYNPSSSSDDADEDEDADELVGRHGAAVGRASLWPAGRIVFDATAEVLSVSL